MKKYILSLCVGLVIILPNCSNRVTEPEKQKEEITWINDCFTLGDSGNNLKFYNTNLRKGDSLNLMVILLEGEYIISIDLIDSENMKKYPFGGSTFRCYLSSGGYYQVVIPSSDWYNLVFLFNEPGSTIKIAVNAKIVRWL